MFHKRKLLRLIKKAIEMEEQVIPIYANHCSLFSECLEFDTSMRKRFLEVFTQLRDDSRRHKDTLENLIKTIEDEL